MARVSNTAHIEEGLVLMRQLRAKQAGQQALTEAAAAHPTHEGHCLKCGERKTVMTEAVKPSAQKGVHRHHGPCPDCGTTVSTFVSKAGKKPEGK